MDHKTEIIIAIVALAVLSCCTILLLKGFNGEIKGAYIAVVGFYFGRLVTGPKNNGNN